MLARDENQPSTRTKSASTALLHPREAAVTLPLSRSMRCGIPVLVLTAIEALLLWSAARTRSRASEPLSYAPVTVRGGGEDRG